MKSLSALSGYSACIFLTAFIVGCATPKVPVNYAPSSVLSANGALSISSFSYQPAEKTGSKIDADQIRNTAMGSIHIDREVKTFVRDAIFAELRSVGIKVNDQNKVLKGDIEEFLVDDLGYSVDWTLRIKYTIVDGTGKQVYQSAKNIQRKTAKFINVFGALNETIKLNAEELINDPAFIKAIN